MSRSEGQPTCRTRKGGKQAQDALRAGRKLAALKQLGLQKALGQSGRIDAHHFSFSAWALQWFSTGLKTVGGFIILTDTIARSNGRCGTMWRNIRETEQIAIFILLAGYGFGWIMRRVDAPGFPA